MASHRVTLITPSGQTEFECSEDLSILDTASARGLALPAVCRGGACSACVARQLTGEAPDQSEQSYLSEDELEAGYVLLCVAYARGECSFETHKTAEYLEQLAAKEG
ncbi:MAG: 2Fe-2S iron-sulfur cluster binding domain-containing protein [Candidatus Eremiobacteraeota bacterium]|nr:2Fe-2S iron-sulfur cluster binding domain-containing protein [Candidatus Eremiobacteraeota bacterium]MCW5866362.1 2Fe-2S iron-sulfur cluster binding domain-containing protein [Candidatus Eremiobacteraeota bacterium]